MPTQRPTQLRQRRNRIIFFWFRVLVSAFWWDVLIRNLGGRKWANRTALQRYLHHARRFHALAIDLGGVMIKLGQFFASRVDILPKEIIDELSSLQDEVPPEAFDAVRRLAEAELGGTLAEKFETFETVPVGAASLDLAVFAELNAVLIDEPSETQLSVMSDAPAAGRHSAVLLASLGQSSLMPSQDGQRSAIRLIRAPQWRQARAMGLAAAHPQRRGELQAVFGRNDFASLVVPAVLAHRVRLPHLLTLTTGNKCLFLQRQVAAAAQLLSLGHVVSWNSHVLLVYSSTSPWAKLPDENTTKERSLQWLF